MKLILGALVIAMTMTACSATPAPEPPRRSETTTSTSTSEPEYGTDEWWVRSAFENFVEALNSKHNDAMLMCKLNAYIFAELLVHHAVNSTEAELAELPVVYRLQVYEMRTTNAALASSTNPAVEISFAHIDNAWLIDLVALFNALSAAVELKGLTADQYVEQQLVQRHGAARAAELRVPMK